MTKRLYVIYDLVAESMVGQLLMFAADAAAVRFFGDVCVDPQTMVARHVEDHELRFVGVVDEESGAVSSAPVAVVLSGKAWKAATDAARANGPELVKEA